MSSLPILTPPQEQVLALISAGSTISQAAQSAGVHRNTVYHWLHSVPAFRPALTEAHHWKAIFWREQVEQLAAAAVDTIRATITDASLPASVRLKAAQSILALACTPPPVEPRPPAPDFFDLLAAPLPRRPPVDAAPPVDSVPNSAQSLPPAAPPTPPALPPAAPPPAAPQPSAPAALPPLRRPAPKIGRNDPCPCGSGKKFKRCCQSAAPEPLPAAA